MQKLPGRFVAAPYRLLYPQPVRLREVFPRPSVPARGTALVSLPPPILGLTLSGGGERQPTLPARGSLGRLWAEFPLPAVGARTTTRAGVFFPFGRSSGLRFSQPSELHVQLGWPCCLGILCVVSVGLSLSVSPIATVTASAQTSPETLVAVAVPAAAILPYTNRINGPH